MKILLHALGVQRGGAFRHITSLLPKLAEADPGNHYVVLVGETCPVLTETSNSSVERVMGRLGILRRLWFDTLAVPKILARERYDAIVSLTNFGPIWSPVPHVLFQRNALYYCRNNYATLRTREKIGVQFRRHLAGASVRRARLVVLPSRAMAEMVKDAFPDLERDRLRVIYHGVELGTVHANSRNSSDLITAEVGVLNVLYPTHAGEHKGFYILFDALAKLKARGVRLRLFATVSHPDGVGVDGYERRVAELGLKNEVRFLGPVPQESMDGLYRAADLMVYPSLCESFGFSMLEAMAFGLPIVAADTAINREICQDAAIFYSARNSDQAAVAIERALSKTTRDGLRVRGAARIASYDWSWARYAREFAGMINELGPSGASTVGV